MPITIRSIGEQGVGLEEHPGCIEHNGNLIRAIIVGDKQRLQGLVGHSINAEYGIGEVLAVECDLPRDDEKSGFFALPDGQIKIDGTVHNIMQIDSDSSVVDVYIRNGPEYIAFDTNELRSIIPLIDHRICIRGRGLVVYPTFT